MTYNRQDSFTNDILTRVINELAKEDHAQLFEDSSDDEEEQLKPLPTQQEVQQFVTPQNRPRLQVLTSVLVQLVTYLVDSAGVPIQR